MAESRGFPRLIGVAGRKRSGKDSVGKILEELGTRRAAFADPLKRAAMDIYGLSLAQTYGTEAQKEQVDTRYGKSARQILQLLGTEVGRHVYVDTWVRAVFEIDIRLYEQHRLVPVYNTSLKLWRFEEEPSSPPARVVRAPDWVITDARYQNEVDEIHRRGGVVLRVTRPSIAGMDTHSSETTVDALHGVDVEILNDGTLEDLRTRVLTSLESRATW